MVGNAGKCADTILSDYYENLSEHFPAEMVRLFQLGNQKETVEDVTLGSPLGSSDHSVLHIDYRWTPALEPDKVIYRYEKSNYNKMKNMLDLDWEQIFSE